MYTREQVAAVIDHAALKPFFTDDDVIAAAHMCIARSVGCLCVRPADITLACKELDESDRNAIREEIGDLFFTLVNLSRRLGVSPESALETSSMKFVRRFNELERVIRDRGGELDQTPLEGLERLWQKSKRGD